MEAWYIIEEPSPGVVAVIDRDGGWFLSNSVLIDMGGYTLVVDTQYNEPRARDLLEIARSRGLPGRFLVVNTHHHGDHAWGNHVIPGPSIMRLEAWRAAEAIAPLVPDVYKQFFPWLDFEGSRYSRPWILAGREPLLLEGEERSAVLRPAGPAHTVGDMLVELPREKILVAGDLAFNGVTPLALEGTVKGWLAWLEEAQERYEGWRVIPGHGPIAGPQVFRQLAAYFRHILGGLEYLLSSGAPRDPLVLAEKLTPGPLLGWKERERLVLNIARALMDFEGKPPGAPVEDLPALAGKMARYREVLEEQIRSGSLPGPP